MTATVDAVEFTGLRLQLTLLNSQVSELRYLTRPMVVLNTNFSSTYVLQERVIVSLILFTRAKFSCCWLFRILITASSVDFFEFPFAKVTFLWLDWRLLSTDCWSEFADRHMFSHLNALILWTYRSWTLHLDSRRFEIWLVQIDQANIRIQVD